MSTWAGVRPTSAAIPSDRGVVQPLALGQGAVGLNDDSFFRAAAERVLAATVEEGAELDLVHGRE